MELMLWFSAALALFLIGAAIEWNIRNRYK